MTRPLPELFDLSGRTAVVTGAGGAIGSAVAAGLTAAGARVAMVDIRSEPLEQAAHEVAGRGLPPVTVVGDTSRPEGASAIVEAVLAAVPRVDILFSNVGSGVHTVPEELSFELFEDVVRINLHSSFLMTQGFGRHMIAEGVRGSIVSTSSTCGCSGMGRGNFAYSLAKAAVIQLTRELAVEWGHFGIRVNAIAPCQLNTPGVMAMLDDPTPRGCPHGGAPAGRHTSGPSGHARGHGRARPVPGLRRGRHGKWHGHPRRRRQPGRQLGGHHPPALSPPALV